MRNLALIILAAFLTAAAAFAPQKAHAGLISKFRGTSPGCVSCHSIKSAGMGGPALAADIGSAYEDFGAEGLGEFLKDIPIPLMADAYAAYPLNDADVDSVIRDFERLQDGGNIYGHAFFRNHGIIGAVLFAVFMVVLLFFFYRRGVKNERS